MSEKNYSSNVRMGNWNEELFLEEDKIKMFMKKRERGELLVQKTRILFNNMLKEVSLDLPEDFINFGHVVQVIAPEVCREGNAPGITLSGLVSEKEVDVIQHFVEGCLVTGSTLLEPCVRNSFTICSADKFQNGQPLKYGQHFCLCTMGPDQCQPLYVESEVPHIQSILGSSKHPLLRLTSFKNIYCLWKILPVNWEYREELEGTPVPFRVSRPTEMIRSINLESNKPNEFIISKYVIPDGTGRDEYVFILFILQLAGNTRVVIGHVASNRNLAVESDVWFTTFFGVECEVTVYSYFNVYKRETPNNIWMLATKKGPNRLEMVKSCNS